jgi:hydrogenase-4 component E
LTTLLTQFVNLLGALLLILAFAMISQRRVLSLINLFTMQGATLVLATAVVGYVTDQPHLYVSAGVTFALKVLLIPWLLHRVADRLQIRWDVETLINIPTIMLVGIVVVIFAFNLAIPISKLSSTLASGTLGIALACVLLSFLMMITRAKAVPQVILGVFMFQIREQFDSLDISHLEKLKDD